MIADKAYSAGTIRRQLRIRSIAAVIPEGATRSPHEYGAAAVAGPRRSPADLNKGRTVAERPFAPAEQWRGLATRYGKLAITYRAATLLNPGLGTPNGRHTQGAVPRPTPAWVGTSAGGRQI
ncbi:hypothetical protein DQ226_11505 [Dietzia maris]|uniref:Uncharacterized protein n=1 Tax=Dietzia maris TaxID=37915 RepID=A0A365P8X0_9ACTN|nr:hypothetical protein DQ226_11505 [Dietzia maris]